MLALISINQGNKLNLQVKPIQGSGFFAAKFTINFNAGAEELHNIMQLLSIDSPLTIHIQTDQYTLDEALEAQNGQGQV